MKPKTIIVAVVLAFVAIILFNNKEEASFWLFGEIRTSKLIILGFFFLLGMIAGGFLFRRKKSHPKEYSINNSNAAEAEFASSSEDNLSEEDREYLSR